MEVFKLAGKIFINDDASKAIDDIDKKADGLGKKLSGVAKTAGKFALGLIGAATAAGGAMLGFATKTSESLDRIDKMSQRLGMSKQAFQEWEFVLSQAGVEIESMQSGMKTLATRMQEASEGAGKGAELFEKLNIQIREGDKQEDIFKSTITALQQMEEGHEKAALAQELFGRSGQELLPLLNSQTGSVDELIQKAHELNLIQSDEAVAAGVVFADTLDQTKRMLSSVWTVIGTALLPIFIKFLQWILDNMPTIERIATTVFGAITDFVVTTAKFIDILVETLKNFYNENEEILKAVYEGFKFFFAAIWDVIEIFIAIFTGDWEGMWKAVDSLARNLLSGILSFTEGIFKGIIKFLAGMGTAFFEAGAAIFENLWSGLKNVWKGIFSWISDKVKWIADKLKFWKKSSDEMKDDPTPSRKPPKGTPMLGNGGILERAGSVIVGDKGPELLNLPRAAKVTPLNLAGAEKGYKTANIEIYLDSETIARKSGQKIVDTIRAKTAMAY